MTSIREDLHEKEQETIEAAEDVADVVEEAEAIQWGPQKQGKLYGYLGPLSVDDIGCEKIARPVQDETELIEILHKGTEVTRLHKRTKATRSHIKVSKEDMFLQVGALKRNALGRPLYEVVEIRRGQKTRVFETHRLNQGPFATHADRSMSIIFSEKKAFNLVFDSVEECDVWWNGLSLMITEAKHADLIVFYLRTLFDQYNQEGLNKRLVRDMLKTLHYRTTKRHLSKLFMEADENHDGVLVFAEFLNMIKVLESRPEIERLFYFYSKGWSKMDAEQLCKFFHEEQKEMHWTVEKCQNMINRQEHGMDRSTFELMLNSPWNMLYSAHSHDNVYHDMTLPLSCYYVSSSHNTYLERGQVRGYSATDMYIQTLKLGARCIELDTWDGDEGEPVIYHGHTLVSRIIFYDAIVAIRDYAFVKTEYPLILSLENHCTIPQQIKMAQYFKDVFGDMLAEPIDYDSVTQLPSPEDLKGKILLKGKKMDTPHLSPDDNTGPPQTPAKDIAPELSELIYFKLMPLKSLSRIQLSNPPPHEMMNFSESSHEKLLEKQIRDILKYNQSNLSRVYTKGTRLRSSNFRPNIHWSTGCQLVAYNFQTPGVAKYIHEGMFADNGGCGYVLKPEVLVSDISTYNPLRRYDGFPGAKYSKLTIRVLSARNLPIPKFDHKINPWVSVQMHGIPVDCAKYHTKRVRGNALNPIWDEKFEFPLKMSQLAVLLVKVAFREYKVKYRHVGHFAVRVENLRPGYRVMPMVNHEGFQSGVSNLFCHISLTPTEEYH